MSTAGSSEMYSEGSVLQAPDGTVAVILGGQRRSIGDLSLVRNLAEVEEFRPRAVSQEEFAAIPKGAAAPLPDLYWDTGLQGVQPGETGHLASFKGRLHRDTGYIVMESRALDVTKLGGFHVRFTVLVVDDKDFPVPSSIPTPSVRIGVDGEWVGTNDRTVAWDMKLTSDDATKVANVHSAWAWDPDNFMTLVAKWQASGQALGVWLDDFKKVAQIFSSKSS